MAHYMVSGTYDEAISDWAQGICTRAVPEDQDFCSVASAYGLLEVDPAAKQMALLIGLGVVLAPMVAECLASALCLRIAGGAADAISPEGAAFASAAGGSAGAGRLLDDLMSAERNACSFTGSTKVLMADGSLKAIEDVESGDYVLAADPGTGKNGPQMVTAVFAHQDSVQDLVTEQGARITTTEDHPFWNASRREWQRADQLPPGDKLLTADGEELEVELLDPAVQTAVAHNLIVAIVNTYYVLVGTQPVLVHNCGGYFPGHADTCTCEGIGDITYHVADSADNFSGHAMQRMKTRGVSEEDARTVLERRPFDYRHEGEWKLGYYDPKSKVFVAKTPEGNVATVMVNVNRSYIDGLIKRSR